MAKKDVYAIVTEKIVEALEKGVIPWQKTWKSPMGEAATSFSTKKPYRGINAFLLSLASLIHGKQCPYWATYKQIEKLGGKPKKGTSQIVTLFKWIVKEEENEDGEIKEKRFPILRYYTVFNLEDCEGIELSDYWTAPVEEARDECAVIEAAEKIVAGYENGPTIKHGGGQAFYRPSADTVQMPEKSSFVSDEAYYSTLFHELSHSTGHESRLNRKGIVSTNFFGSHEYSQEELVAEMSASFLNAEAGILDDNFDNSVAYIQSWLKALDDDRKMVVMAAQQAQKAADHILGREVSYK